MILVNSHDGSSSYQMLGDDGAKFDAPIPPFRLAMPGVLN